jgi:hypothetical protein
MLLALFFSRDKHRYCRMATGHREKDRHIDCVRLTKAQCLTQARQAAAAHTMVWKNTVSVNSDKQRAAGRLECCWRCSAAGTSTGTAEWLRDKGQNRQATAAHSRVQSHMVSVSSDKQRAAGPLVCCWHCSSAATSTGTAGWLRDTERKTGT